MGNKPYNFKPALLFVFGYICAVLAAVTVTTSIYFIFNYSFVGFANNLRPTSAISPPEFFLIGLLYTGMFAFPGYVISLLIAKLKQHHSYMFYTIAGFFTCLSAHLILGALSSWATLISDTIPITIISTIGGVAGGFSYCFFRQKVIKIDT